MVTKLFPSMAISCIILYKGLILKIGVPTINVVVGLHYPI